MDGLGLDKKINLDQQMEEIKILAAWHQQLPQRKIIAKILDKANEVYFCHSLYGPGGDLIHHHQDFECRPIDNDYIDHDQNICANIARKYLGKIEEGEKYLQTDPCHNERYWMLLRTMAEKFIQQGRREKRKVEEELQLISEDID